MWKGKKKLVENRRKENIFFKEMTTKKAKKNYLPRFSDLGEISEQVLLKDNWMRAVHND